MPKSEVAIRAAAGEAEHDPHSPRVALPARGRATDNPAQASVRGGEAQLRNASEACKYQRSPGDGPATSRRNSHAQISPAKASTWLAEAGARRARTRAVAKVAAGTPEGCVLQTRPCAPSERSCGSRAALPLSILGRLLLISARLKLSQGTTHMTASARTLGPNSCRDVAFACSDCRIGAPPSWTSFEAKEP